MNTGLSTKQWVAVSEPWSPTTRAAALELLIWLWEHKTALPNVPKTLQRLARVDDGRVFKQAWAALTAPAPAGLLVEGPHGWTCPLQDAARGIQEARSRAGKASADSRRQAARMTMTVQTTVPPFVRTESPPGSYPQPVENLLKTGGNVVEKGVTAVEIGPPQTPPLANVLSTKILDLDQRHGVAAGAAPVPVPGEHTQELKSPNLDIVALYVAAYVLTENRGRPMEWDAFRDAATAAIGKLYELDKTAPKVDQTDLTYRVWDEQFLGAYRDRFAVTRTHIAPAGETLA